MDIDLKNFLIGLSLGDGHIRKEVSALQIQHGQKQLDYLKYKRDLLSNLSNTSIEIQKFDNGGYIGYRIYYRNEYCSYIRNWLYPNDKKFITKEILHRLSDLEIAIWYMDDGSLYKKSGKSGDSYEVVISTYCQTEKEAQGIIDFFKERYDATFTIKRNKGKFSIRCGKKAAIKLFDKIKVFVPECMSYKIFS